MKKKHLIIPLSLMLSLSGCVMYNGLPPEEAAHEHTYSEEYSSNETEHWFAATCEHTDLRKDIAPHTFSDFVTTQEPTLLEEGKKVRTCTVCGYKDVQKIDKLSGGGEGQGGEQGGGQEGGNTETWTITDIAVDRTSIELTVGDNPVSVIPTLVGTGNFPKTIAIYSEEMSITKTVEGEEVTEKVKVVDLSANVVESGHAFTVSAVNAGTTTITVKTTYTDPEISKTINVIVNPKVERHELSVLDSDIEINKGSVYVLNCTSTDDVTWTSSDDTVVGLENKTNTGVWLKGLKSSGSDKVTITATICAGTEYEVVKTCLVKVVNTEQTVFNYYYINNQKLKDLHLYLWGEGVDANEAWPGTAMVNKSYVNRDFFDVYKITIDKEVAAYERMIVSGKDANGEFVQTDDILLTSFVTQNAFSIPNLPTDVVEGTRKASVRLSTFNPNNDALDNDYLFISMESAELLEGNTIDVAIFTSADEVDIKITSGVASVQLYNESYRGFSVRGLKEGNATVEVSVLTSSGKLTKTLAVSVIKDTKVTYLFTNNYAWSELYVYFWNDSIGRENASFPGVRLTDANIAYTDEDGAKVYEVSYYQIADNWQGFIISGADASKTGMCKTENVLFSSFGTNNGIKLNGWKANEGEDANTALVEYGNFANTPYVKTNESNVKLQVGSTYHLDVFTNGQNVEYEVYSGAAYVELLDASKNGVTIKGIEKGSSALRITVDSNLQKTISIKVVEDEDISIYFVNEYEWIDVKAHLFIDQEHNNGWPGDSMVLLGYNKAGKEVYKTTFKKLGDAWTGVVFSGMDVTHAGRAQTGDIQIADLLETNNSVRVTGWIDENGLVASSEIIACPDYLMISKDNLSIPVSRGEFIYVSSNKTVSIVSSDTSVVTIEKIDDMTYYASGQKEGNATITFSIGTGDSKVERVCNVTVGEDKLVTYYFSNNYCWTDLRVHYWGPKGEFDTIPTYMGLKNKEGQDVYKLSFYKILDGYTGLVIFGVDGSVEHGESQTVDINFDLLGEGQNNFYLTGWTYENENEKATIGTAHYDPYFLEINDKGPKTILTGDSFQLEYNANYIISKADYDGFMISVDEDFNEHVVTITGLLPGTTTITFYIYGEEENHNEISYTVNVLEEYEYTITDVPSWYPNDGATLYVWAWDANDNGQWIAVTCNDGTITFASRTLFVGALIVRFDDKFEGDPSWDKAYWNKSADLSFSNYVAVFAEE